MSTIHDDYGCDADTKSDKQLGAECVQQEVECGAKQEQEQEKKSEPEQELNIPISSVPSCASCLETFGTCLWNRFDADCRKFWNQVRKNRGEI